ncbi:methyltransferase-like protein 27 [Cheilinus undulatus]|uniref:methyltransferase-like protein 27 n=1 Tax=Cheilinus undulatus TaxID=241271 RepID=UPI001BD45257|nr:methyltransferase-like protein 27 [Cheilinus undulatus]
MSDGRRTVDSMKALLQSCQGADSQQTINFYDSWCETYEQDFELLNYRAPHHGVSFLHANFSGSREDVQVLDVACGSGLVAKLMTELGFRNFVGVDASKGMLEVAAKTGLYQDLKLALLGTEPLPASNNTFDVVILVGGLGPGFIPVRIVRELCSAAKPGGLVCLVRGEHRGAPSDRYKHELHTELKLMEEAGLWSLLATKHIDRYMVDAQANTDGDQQGELFISGMAYLYRKAN